MEDPPPSNPQHPELCPLCPGVRGCRQSPAGPCPLPVSWLCPLALLGLRGAAHERPIGLLCRGTLP